MGVCSSFRTEQNRTEQKASLPGHVGVVIKVSWPQFSPSRALLDETWISPFFEYQMPPSSSLHPFSYSYWMDIIYQALCWAWESLLKHKYPRKGKTLNLSQTKFSLTTFRMKAWGHCQWTAEKRLWLQARRRDRAGRQQGCSIWLLKGGESRGKEVFLACFSDCAMLFRAESGSVLWK